MEVTLNNKCVKYHCMGEGATFGQIMARLRKAAHMNQRELARALGKSPTYISYLERDINPASKSGKPRPSQSFVDDAARILNDTSGELHAVTGYVKAGGETNNGTGSVLGEIPDADDLESLKATFDNISLKFPLIPPDKRVNVKLLTELLNSEVERLTKK